MNFVSLEEFMKTDSYNNFIKENPSIGKLKIEAFTAYGAIPIPETKILITKEIDGQNVLFFSGMTDSSGIIDNIELPAPVAVLNANQEDVPNYTIYNLTAIHEGFETIKRYRVGMFGDISIIQYVKMTPEIELKGVDQSGN